MKRKDRHSLAMGYLKSKRYLILAGFGGEIDQQEKASLETVTESDLLREHAWVVLNSGMRESVIRKLFPFYSSCFFDWVSADKIVVSSEQCISSSAIVFGSSKKNQAVISFAKEVSFLGVEFIIESLKEEGIEFLQRFPFLGPATSAHLAKNLGVQTSKPDRHLVRLSQRLDYPSPQTLCDVIAHTTGDPVSVVDLVLWRLCTLGIDYVSVCSSDGGFLRNDNSERFSSSGLQEGPGPVLFSSM